MRSFLYFNKSGGDIIKALIVGVMTSTILIACLLCAMCFVFLFCPLPQPQYLQYIMLIIDALGVFCGGYIAARINKSKGLLTGLGIGAIISIGMISSGFIYCSTTLTIITPLKVALILIASMLGGIKGVNVKEKIKIK